MDDEQEQIELIQADNTRLRSRVQKAEELNDWLTAFLYFLIGLDIGLACCLIRRKA